MTLPTVLRALRPRAIGRLAALAVLLAMPIAGYAEDYVADPTFNNGLIGADNFASSTYDYRFGKKITRLDNGDIIAAGVVPGVGTAAGHQKLGLVRYNQAGIRQTWSNPGGNGFFNNEYVITPCTGSAWCGDVKDVKDIRRFGNRVFVLADTEDFHVELVGNNPPLPVWVANPSVDVYVFGIDGALQAYGVMDSDDYAADDSRTVLGGGIAVYDNAMFPTVTSLVYAGTGIVDGIYRPRFARFKVESNGTLTSEVGAIEPAFGSLCAAGDFCQFAAIALGGRASTTSAPRIYIVGSRWHPGPGPGQIGWDAGWDVFVAGLNSTGTPRTSFATNGLYTTEAFAASSQSGGVNIAVDGAFSAISQDEVFVVADVELPCRHGVAVMKLGQTGSAVSTFGLGGQVRYGGSDQTNAAQCSLGWLHQSIRTDYPTDIVYSNGKLGVSGINVYGPGVLCPAGETCPEDNVDGEVAVIDSNTGAIESWRGYAYADAPGGARSRHSGFWGIVANGDDTFSLAGDVRYFNRTNIPADQRGKQMFATLRVAPRGDVIFANGFDTMP
jgi:hypothetical protein